MEDEVCCKNCGLPASDYFAMIGEKMPDYINHCNTWYCSESCYDEDTQHEG